MQITEIDTYYPAQNADFSGNPLIEFLPPLYEAQILDAMTSFEPCTDSERSASPDLRMQYVQRLFDLFVPSPSQLQVGVQVWNSICQSYVRKRRRKVTPKTTQTFQAMCQAFLDGEPPPKESAVLSDLPNCVVLIGTPGCGKTQVLKRLLRRLSQDSILFHPRHNNLYQRLYLWAEAGTTKTDKALAEVIYEDLYESLIATGAKRSRVRGSARRLGIECAAIADKLNLGALVIDEIQHWLKKRVGVDKDAVEFLTTLVNEIGCTVVLIGTWEALPILRSTVRSGRRACSLGTTFMRKIPPGEVWDAFIQMLFMVQYTSTPVDCTPELTKTLWYLTQGIPDLAVRLLAFAQCAAIADESETITETLLEQCAKESLDYIQPAIKQMRDGAGETDFIWDAEPEDIEAYTQRILAEYLMSAAVRKAKQRVSSAAARAAAVGVATGVINALGFADPPTAENFANGVSEKNPSAQAGEIVEQAIKAAKDRAPRRSTSPKRQAAIDQEHAALPPLDMRRIVHQCKRTKADPEAALDEIGHLFHIGEWEVA